MKNYYFVDNLTHTVKLSLSQDVEDKAYKGMVTDSFKAAKEFAMYGLLSKYDTEWDLYQIPIFGFKKLNDLTEELRLIDEECKQFVEEFQKYGHSVEEFIKSEEWKTRKELASNYKFYISWNKFIEIEYKDRLLKNAYKKNQYNFVRMRSKQRKSKESMLKLKSRELFREIDQELKDLKKDVLHKSRASGLEASRFRKEYADFHDTSTLSPLRANDVKNILILYLDKKTEIEKQIFVCELFIASCCRKAPYKTTVTKTKDLTTDNLKWDIDNGFNVHILKDDVLYEGVFIGEAYNRLAVLGSNGKLARNNDFLVVLENAKGESLHYKGNFFDKDEYDITDNALALEAAVNPILTLYYQDKFNIEEEDE